MSEIIEEPIETENAQAAASTDLNIDAVSSVDGVTPDLSDRFVRYDAGELKNEFIAALNEMTTRLQTGDAAKLLGNDLMKKFRQAENKIRTRLDGDFKLVVMGDFKRGKSTLVNALLKMNVATTNVTPETVTINEIEWGETLSAEACLTDGGRVSLGVNELAADTLLPFVERLEEQNKLVDHIEINVPIDWLRGVQLVDTPGMGDILNRFDKQVQEYLQRADAIVFLVSALSPLSETEENFLRLSLKPADFNRLIFIVNMLDFARTSEEATKVYNLITQKIGRQFPNAQVFGISALDEICRLQNTPRPNNERSDELAAEFDRLRSVLHESILLDRNLIQLDRACGLLNRATREIENAAALLRGAMQQDQHKLAQAVTDLSDDNSELAHRVAEHKKTMRAEITELGKEAEGWMDEFFNRLERETVGGLSNFTIEDVQKHFQFFLTDAVRDALNACVEAHSEELLASAKKARLAIQGDAEDFAQIDLNDTQIAAATSAHKDWTGFDSAASVLMLLGAAPIAEFLKVGSKLFFKDARGKDEIDFLKKHLESTLPELRRTLRDEVKETYLNIAVKFEAEIERTYEQNRTETIAALEQAQVVKNSAELEFSNSDQIFNEISEVLNETRAEIDRLEDRIFPPEAEFAAVAA